MSIYKNRAEFISRTLSFLDKYEKDCNFEKTFFLNCCLGLLVIPQQCAVQDSNLYVSNIVDYENWGIDVTKIKDILPPNDYSIENIARHIRNSLCHFRFDIMQQDTEKIKTIQVIDYEGNNKSFDLTLDFADFKKFILKYANELKSKLDTL